MRLVVVAGVNRRTGRGVRRRRRGGAPVATTTVEADWDFDLSFPLCLSLDDSSGLFSSGLTVERTTIIRLSRSNQKGAPNEIAKPVINHPRILMYHSLGNAGSGQPMGSLSPSSRCNISVESESERTVCVGAGAVEVPGGGSFVRLPAIAIASCRWPGSL